MNIKQSIGGNSLEFIIYIEFIDSTGLYYTMFAHNTVVFDVYMIPG